MLVDRSQNVLSVSTLANPGVPGAFVVAIRDGKSRGFEHFYVDMSSVQGAFPNVCVPLAGLIDYYARQEGLDFTFTRFPDVLNRYAFTAPRSAEDNVKDARNFALNTVWRYRDIDGVNALVSGFRDAIAQAAVCEKGVLEALEWSLNEVMDNVLHHSSADCGLVMGQVHSTSRNAALCVFDYGRGIYESFSNTEYAPKSPGDAITLALKEGVTRDKSTNQGNGLWGLNNIVTSNSGMLAITSGRGSYSASGNAISVENKTPYPSPQAQCTTVDFQIALSSPISLFTALGGFEPVNFKVENMEDVAGNLQMKICEWSAGTGTRKSGAAIRNEVLNLCNQTASKIVLDFTSVGVIASSFADEFLGRLISEMGVAGFMSRIELKGMNQIIQTIANRSIAQRISQTTKL